MSTCSSSANWSRTAHVPRYPRSFAQDSAAPSGFRRKSQARKASRRRRGRSSAANRNDTAAWPTKVQQNLVSTCASQQAQRNTYRFLSAEKRSAGLIVKREANKEHSHVKISLRFRQMYPQRDFVSLATREHRWTAREAHVGVRKRAQPFVSKRISPALRSAKAWFQVYTPLSLPLNGACTYANIKLRLTVWEISGM